jgi:hypothetical protein
MTVLTRDRRPYRDYFPSLAIVAPDAQPKPRAYSACSTLTGSTAVARRAGTRHAGALTAIKTHATPNSVRGSYGCMS